MLKWLTNIVGDSNEREIKRLQPVVARINRLEPEFEALTNDELREKTTEFKERLHDGETLDELLPEAFAAVREAAKRTIGQRHFDVQLLGGMVLHQGKIAEMRTGEGKTLVATLPVYLNALTERGVHVITVNDYLARRDSQWMGPIYHMLGVSVASVQHESSFLFDPDAEVTDERLHSMRPVTRREAYLADITYGTNNEFGFDYLRDNMVVDLSHMVQRDLYFAIVDEVDNILIDEARTPLIISGQAEEPTDKYYTFARLVPRLRSEEDYKIDEKHRAVTLTEEGIAKVEGMLGISNLYDPKNYESTHYLENALKAEVLFKRDHHYVAKDGQVIIVDEFTGRLMFGRRYSEGLHQAIEAKEGLKIQRESVTLATITFQNYFRMYEKLAGMTGTAVTEAEEFHKIYKLEVVVIPTHRTMIRQDYPDQVYKTESAKYNAVVKEIVTMHEKGRPALVGTVSIEKSEMLSDMLMRRGIPHQVLNAKLHEKEAGIIAQAGRLGAVTIATNMAGRGTDIILGGSPPDPVEHERVKEAGGLHIIGTERHEARRIDNQLRGRAGRQGDPGSTRFYVSLEDEIMRRFGGDRIKSFMEWAGLEDDVPIEHGLVTKSIENAQVKVEGYHFDMRKHLVDYDDVMNRQREVVYEQRKKILSGADLKANIEEWIQEEISGLVNQYIAGDEHEERDTEGLLHAMAVIIPLPPDLTSEQLQRMSRSEIEDGFLNLAEAVYEAHEQQQGPENMRLLERLVMLRIIDNLWIHHLTAMEELREGITLRAYGQVDPLIAFKKEAFEMYDHFNEAVREQVVNTIFKVGLVQEPAPIPQPVQALKTNQDAVEESHRRPVPVAASKVGRNDPCPCGSGKKYKKCHGS